MADSPQFFGKALAIQPSFVTYNILYPLSDTIFCTLAWFDAGSEQKAGFWHEKWP